MKKFTDSTLNRNLTALNIHINLAMLRNYYAYCCT